APRPQLRKIDERGRAQPDGSVNFIETIAVERPAGDFLDRLAEQHVAQVAVKRLRAGRARHLFAVNLLEDIMLGGAARDEIYLARPLVADDVLIVGFPRRQARGMREQLAERDVGLPENAEVGKEARHALVEAD